MVPVRLARWWSRQFTDAWQDKKHQKKVAAEFIGTLLFTFLAGAGVLSASLLQRTGCLSRGTGEGDAPLRGALFSRAGRGILRGRQSAGQGGLLAIIQWCLMMLVQHTLMWQQADANCVGVAAAVNAESSGLVTGALGGGLAFAVMVYATAGAPASCCAHVDEE